VITHVGPGRPAEVARRQAAGPGSARGAVGAGLRVEASGRSHLGERRHRHCAWPSVTSIAGRTLTPVSGVHCGRSSAPVSASGPESPAGSVWAGSGSAALLFESATSAAFPPLFVGRMPGPRRPKAQVDSGSGPAPRPRIRNGSPSWNRKSSSCARRDTESSKRYFVWADSHPDSSPERSKRCAPHIAGHLLIRCQCVAWAERHRRGMART
jgi:hypothetical protein